MTAVSTTPDARRQFNPDACTFDRKDVKRKADFTSCSCAKKVARRANNPAFLNSHHQRSLNFTLNNAPSILQRFWRISRGQSTIRIILNYQASIPMTSDLKSIRFDALMNQLRVPVLLDLSRRCIERIRTVCTLRNPTATRSSSLPSINVKEFLAALLMCCSPAKFFPEGAAPGSDAAHLLDSAAELLHLFERVCLAIAEGQSPPLPADLARQFLNALATYLQRFKEWKAPDEAKVIARIKIALAILYRAAAAVPPSVAAGATVPPAVVLSPPVDDLQAQISQLRAKLARLAGEEALRRLDEERLGVTKAAASVSLIPEAVAGGGAAASPPSLAAAGHSPGGVAAGPWPPASLTEDGGCAGTGMFPSEDGSAVGSATSAITAAMTANEMLFHELLLDPAFQLPDICTCAGAGCPACPAGGGGAAADAIVDLAETEGRLEGIIPVAGSTASAGTAAADAAAVERAFWGEVADDLRRAPPAYDRLFGELAAVKSAVVDLVGASAFGGPPSVVTGGGGAGGSGMAEEATALAEAVDLDFARAQAEAGVYSWDSCVGLIRTLAASVESAAAAATGAAVAAAGGRGPGAASAAAVEAALRELAAGGDGSDGDRAGLLCRAVALLQGRVRSARVAAANRRLRLAAPSVASQGADYERARLRARLDSGVLTLERARAWIRRAVAREVRLDPGLLPALLAGRPAAFAAVHNAAVLELAAAGLAAEGDSGALVAGGASSPPQSATAAEANMVPETLLLDAGRLARAAEEFRHVTFGAQMLAAAAYAVAASGGDVAVRERILGPVADHLCAAPAGGACPAAAAAALEAAAPQAAPALVDAARRAILSCDSAATTPASATLNALLARRMREVWAAALRGGGGGWRLGPDEHRALGPARPLAGRVERATAELRAVGALNRRVHAELYNDLIREAAAAQQASAAAAC